MLWGPPGVGKSQWQTGCGGVRSARHRHPLKWSPQTSEAFHFTWACGLGSTVYFLMPNAGPRGVLFLDEINAAALNVSAAAHQLILDRKLRIPTTIRLVFVAAGNHRATVASPTPCPPLSRIALPILSLMFT